MLTPWGEAGELRQRMLASGPRPSPEGAAQNQRERLFGAMVASCAERGYEATTVSDLVALSGLSRRDFYRHFPDKRGCFEATLNEILKAAMGSVALRYDGRGSALAALIELIVAQPAAARLCFVEVYAAGPGAMGQMEQALVAVEDLYAHAFAARGESAAMPAQICQAIVGGLHKVVYTRLRGERERELLTLVPTLWEWSFGYEAPPGTLARPRGDTGAAGRSRPEDPVQRILEATTETVAMKGFAAATLNEIVAAAGVSLTTLYQHFEGKKGVVGAALDAGHAQLFAQTLPAFRRARSWPEAVRNSFEAMFAFFAAEPAFARMAMVEVYAAGTAALDRRDRTVGSLQVLLDPGFERAPKTPRIASEAIGGATYALIYRQIRSEGPESLPMLTPSATYIALAPFLGPAEALAVANGRRGR